MVSVGFIQIKSYTRLQPFLIKYMLFVRESPTTNVVKIRKVEEVRKIDSSSEKCSSTHM